MLTFPHSELFQHEYIWVPLVLVWMLEPFPFHLRYTSVPKKKKKKKNSSSPPPPPLSLSLSLSFSFSLSPLPLEKESRFVAKLYQYLQKQLRQWHQLLDQMRWSGNCWSNWQRHVECVPSGYSKTVWKGWRTLTSCAWSMSEVFKWRKSEVEFILKRSKNVSASTPSSVWNSKNEQKRFGVYAIVTLFQTDNGVDAETFSLVF